MKYMPIKILALFGKSGSGKDTIQNALLESFPDTFHKIISYTTRPRRQNEQEGFDYHFISIEEFADLAYADQFIEALEFNGWFYGTATNSLDQDKINIGIFTPEGVECLFSEVETHNLQVLPVYVYALDTTRLIRSLKRELNPNIEEIFRRWQADEADFSSIDYNFEIVHNQTEPMKWDYILNTIDSYCKDFFD